VKLVLDTNVVLDWLVFDDPYMNPLRDGVKDQRVVVLTCQQATEELRRVLSYPSLRLSELRQSEVFEQYVAQSSQTTSVDQLPLDRTSLPRGFPRCSDPDDNTFLALALHARADALVSRDNAVLALRRRATKFGLSILNVQQMITALRP
jgi:putative PIN family toxin of toxin-antitoxin system